MKELKTCPFCGHTFGPEEARPACRGCGLASSCGKTCCPRCGYELAPEPWRPFGRRRHRQGALPGQRDSDGLQPVTELAVGETGTIGRISTADPAVLRKLAALGIFPGNQVQLVQKFPAYVFRLDLTTVAVDSDIARHIYVRLDKTGRLDYKE